MQHYTDYIITPQYLTVSLSHDVDIEGAVGGAKLSGSGKREGLAILDQ